MMHTLYENTHLIGRVGRIKAMQLEMEPRLYCANEPRATAGQQQKGGRVQHDIDWVGGHEEQERLTLIGLEQKRVSNAGRETAAALRIQTWVRGCHARVQVYMLAVKRKIACGTHSYEVGG